MPAVGTRRGFLFSLGLVAIRIRAAIFGTYLPSANWWVDSVNGSDSNTGLSAGQAFATIGKLLLQSIQAGDTIALASGSSWREELVVPVNNVIVVAYGTGAAPILDAADSISAGAWTKTGGQTAVYQCTVSIDADGSSWVSVWENFASVGGVVGRLLRASSIANCDAIPGSYFPSSDSTSPITLYVHTSDGSNPASNGKTYEYSKRKTGYRSYDVTGTVVCGITTQRNLWNNGSLTVGINGKAYTCTALYGSKHNVLGREGSAFYGCVAQEAYFGGSSFIMYVYNENMPTGKPVTFVRCSAALTSYDSNSTGFYGHVNTSGLFGTLTLDTCTTTNCAIGFSGNSASSAIVSNCVATGCNVGYYADHDWRFVGCSASASQGGNPQVLNVGGVSNVEVSGLSGSSIGYWVWIMANANVYFHDCGWSAISGPIMIDIRGSNATVKVRSVQFNNSPSLPYTIVNGVTGITLDSDYNTFTAHGSGNYVGQIAGTYYNQAQWQALGYDTHSTFS